MNSISRAGLALLAVAAVAAPALAQNLAKERGNIVAVDWQSDAGRDQRPPEPRRARGRCAGTRRWCSRTRSSEFPNPKLTDLRAPMYVHFTFDADTKVVEPVRGESRSGFETSQGGPGIQQTGVITNLDANIGHVEVNLGAGSQTFAVDPKGQLGDFRIGDSVSILDRDARGQPRGRHAGEASRLRAHAGRTEPSPETASSRTWTRTSATSR